MTIDTFLNRELWWLEGNRPYLEAALDSAAPLLERLKSLALISTNLDDFFTGRMPGPEATDPRNRPDHHHTQQPVYRPDLALSARPFSPAAQAWARGRRRRPGRLRAVHADAPLAGRP